MKKRKKNQGGNKKRNNKSNPLSQGIIEKMMRDRKVRIAATGQSHYLFFHLYFAHYVKYPTAPFQKDIFHLTESENAENAYIVSFRGSGKSTIMTMSYPIWAILGKKKKRFVVIFCQTVSQAKQHMTNLRRELESNELLKNDLGPFREEGDWGSSSLVFSALDARITVASTEQSIRGIRHNQFRPDLLILDDVEDLMSAKTREGRDKNYQWLTGEVVPLGDKGTEMVIVGNLLHEDSLLMRLKRQIEEEKLKGKFMYCPLLDKSGNITWPGKYPDLAAIQAERMKVGNEAAWQREYLLRIIPTEQQVIFRDWINYYDELPAEGNHIALVSVDLAISDKDSADYTAVVNMVVYRLEGKFRAYVLPNPINARMDFPTTVEILKREYETLKLNYRRPEIIVEDVGYQLAVPQMLTNARYPAKGQKVKGDKRSRLATCSNLIKDGTILFPRHGAEELISQVVNFGSERHDDLVDALTLAIHRLIAEGRPYRASDFIC